MPVLTSSVVFPLLPIVAGVCGCGDKDCERIGKHPAIPWGEITCDNQRELSHKPAAGDGGHTGYGIKTGAPPYGSGIVVVDVDGPEALKRWEDLNAGAIPATYQVATGRGWQWYFQHPGFRVPNSASEFAQGIDIRGDGGFVVGPGSPHRNGKLYTVVCNDAPAPAPEWLLAWFRRQGEHAPAAEPQTYPGDVDGAELEYNRKLFAEFCQAHPRSFGGSRHMKLFPVVQRGGLDLRLPDADILEIIAEHFNPRCMPPMTPSELRASVLGHCRGAKTKSTRTRAEPLPADLAHLVTGPSLALPPAPRIEVTQSVPGASADNPRLTPEQRALRVGGSDVARLATGLPSIDTATRGGILLRKLIVIGGAPGAGKTALLVRLGFHWLSQGVCVGMLASDEDADAILIRFGQLVGIPRDDLERGDQGARVRLAEWCRSVPLILSDGDEDNATIESLSAEVRARAGDGPGVLLVDSIQTARNTSELPKGADLRTRINENVRVLKRAAKVHGHLVISTSELSKAAYRNKSQSENVNALSAFKESGDIEYGVALAIVLVSCAGSPDLVDASIVKNRLGRGKPEFLLRLDHDRADVRETRREDEMCLDPFFDVKRQIAALIAQEGPMSKNAITDKIGLQRTKALKIITEMVEDQKWLHIDARDGSIRFPLPGEPGYKP